MYNFANTPPAPIIISVYLSSQLNILTNMESSAMNRIYVDVTNCFYSPFTIYIINRIYGMQITDKNIKPKPFRNI